MIDAHASGTSTRAARRWFSVRTTVTRLAAVVSIVVGVLAVAGPSWAGPITGC